VGHIGEEAVELRMLRGRVRNEEKRYRRMKERLFVHVVPEEECGQGTHCRQDVDRVIEFIKMDGDSMAGLGLAENAAKQSVWRQR
jgi:hypothetical protein